MNTNFLKIAVIGVFAFLASKLFPSKEIALVNGKNYMVGDSHAVGIGSRIPKLVTDPLIAKGGWRVSNLINALKTYPVSADVARVFISIGTNGQFTATDNVAELTRLLKLKFPNAKFYIFGGSYGWSMPKDKNTLENRFNVYYKKFTDKGIILLKNRLGYFTTDAAAHSTTSNAAKAIINEISTIIK
jgi:hypothetical protein